MLNLKAENSHYIFDFAGMLVVPSDQSWEKRSLWKRLWDWILKRAWTPKNLGDLSWKDSIGRTVLAIIAYGFVVELANGIYRCFKDGKLYRHPDHNILASRDHHSYFLIYNKLFCPADFDKFIKQMPRMRGMNLWMKSLTGNRTSEFFYYSVQIPGAYLGNWWLKFCRWVGDISRETSNGWWVSKQWVDSHETCGEVLQLTRTTWQKLWGWIIFQTIPAYPLHNKAWQIYVMPESRKKEKLQRVLLKRVAKRNVLVRLVLGDDTVTQEEVDNMPAMTGFPSGVYLDETCRRDIRQMDAIESEFNMYELDLIKWL